MWVRKALSFNRDRATSSALTPNAHKSKSLQIDHRDGNDFGSVNSKRRRKGGCFSFKEVSMEPETASTLTEVDSSKLKAEIMRWAKAVVAYARQVSGRFGISSANNDSRRHSNKSGADSYGDVGSG
ncbi:hypothetical protein MLD38_007162 [Melastoma candidum]|uniref:Uncharacterized protein n=1 Tax=Melastoma candidum TaxID=119954 RepID=A0ACB9RPR1_9MYRT|nr:hypothetical protein MLD38_007162 [Melastoma candidum]